jgi:anti-sigma factor RsiW
MLRLKQALRDKLPPEQVPPQLQARVERAVGLNRHASRPTWMALAAALVVAVLGSAITTGMFFRTAEGEVIDGAFIDNHVRAMRATKPVDVVSTDQHTVKPWFDGKSIQSPQVVDLSAQGYPLVGGRIDVIHDTVVPVVVYSRRLHLIDVWALRPGFTTNVNRGARTLNGYNILPFTAHGARYLAASNLAADELEGFTKLLQAAP